MEYETREYERTRRRSRSEEEYEENKPSDFITPVIIVQLVVFILISLVFFGLYKKQSDTYLQIRSFYNNVMKRDMTAKEIADGAKSVLNFLSEPRMLQEKTQTDGEAKELNGAGGEDLLSPKDNTSFSPVYLSKEIVKPVESNRTTSKFGYRINPVTDTYGFHSGLDIAAKEGTPIKAAFSGKIARATSSKLRGNYIFLDSGNVTTVYCHCSKLLVEEGDTVKAGDVIAKVGSTGQVTGPHLHFELLINDVYYNPEWVLKY